MLFISSYLIIDIFISLTARFNVGASLRTWMTLIGTYPIGVRQNTTINHNTVEFVVFMSQEKLLISICLNYHIGFFLHIILMNKI